MRVNSPHNVLIVKGLRTKDEIKTLMEQYGVGHKFKVFGKEIQEALDKADVTTRQMVGMCNWRRPLEKEIDHEGTDEITCPHCGLEYGDSWEFSPQQECGTEKCQDCGKDFEWSRSVTVTYTTNKVSCTKQGLEHQFEEPRILHLDADHVKRYGRPGDVPHQFHMRDCAVCKETQYSKDQAIGSDAPPEWRPM
ncbi:hypothetical protein [Methylobacter sp.]|uniref:hypothetical protein n=1 Tax=Methylobacter sp. TaxID=2051955 RepID=UPI0011F7631E|nr:hypothetical protein [Methylobacter sp.]TAK59503.1 MAG: hypothetical protein EPO18_20285 [Methylobacter sp.]